MAKTIKFNLLIDGKYVRDIESLRENFCINDILEVYKNGLLEKWLKVRGIDDYLSKVEKIDKTSNNSIVELIKIFDMEKDNNAIGEAIYSLDFENRKKQKVAEFEKSNQKLKDTIESYHKAYEDLKEEILQNKENMQYLKTASNEISEKYLKLFQLDYHKFFFNFKGESPLFIYAILMNEQLKSFWLKNDSIKKELNGTFTLSTLEQVDSFIKNFEIFKKLGEVKNAE